MCELLYIRSKTEGKPIQRSKIEDLVLAAQNGAYANSDGTGAFNQYGRIFRTEEALHELDYREVVNRLYGSEEVVLHIRASTRGSVCADNAHPFQQDNQVLAHNGTMHGLHGEDGEVDSEQFLNRVVEADGDNTLERVENSLEETRGWLSIFYRDIASGDTYYFRNRANFTFGETHDCIVGATSSKRLDQMQEFGQYDVFGRFEPVEGRIYRLDNTHPETNGVAEYELSSDTHPSRTGGYSSGTYRLVSTREYRTRDSRSGDREPEQRDGRTYESYEDYKESDEYRRRAEELGWDDDGDDEPEPSSYAELGGFQW